MLRVACLYNLTCAHWLLTCATIEVSKTARTSSERCLYSVTVIVINDALLHSCHEMASKEASDVCIDAAVHESKAVARGGHAVKPWVASLLFEASMDDGNVCEFA